MSMALPEFDPDIWGKVQRAFAEALGLEEDEVEPHHKVIGDLEAESLDFLDIAFRLERAFDIKIPRGGIEQTAREGDGGVDDSGVLTADGLARLVEAMPEVPAEEFHEGLRVTEIAELFRVATFYSMVVKLIEEKAAGASA
jgi:acyl carrier protein